MPQALTQAKVDKATTTTRALIADGSCRGLYLDVRPTGKSYRYRYTQACGQQRTGNIGDAPILKLSEARQLTRELIHKRLMGENIIPQKKPPQPPRVTMGEFIHKRYIPHGRVTKRCFDSEISTIRTHILPAFGHRLMSEITKAEITSFIHDKIPTGLAPGTINKILNAVKSIYARAVEWEAAGLEKNPAHGIKQLPDHPRHEKFLTQDEASRLLGAVATSQNKMLGSIVALLLLTGCRKREVLDARWEYIDFEHGLLTIPLSKSGKPRRVLLSPAAKAVIIQSKQILRAELGEEADTCPWILPNPATGQPFNSIYHSWNTARQSVGLGDVRVHDLRHSFASALVNRGATLFDVQKLLGHSSPQMTERYAHLTTGRLMDAAIHAQNHYAIPTLTLTAGM